MWSPDGTKIAFDGTGGLYTMTASGSSQTNIDTSGSYPSWSPDGTKIVFQKLDGLSITQIFVANADGSSQTALTSSSDPNFNPVWSPDGNKIVWNGPLQTIQKMNPDGTSKTTVFTAANGAGVQYPTWSPDSSTILFSYYIPGTESTYGLYSVSASGGTATQLYYDSSSGVNTSMWGSLE
ncbi:MAG: TolB family protein [Candidatus Levyibacteriota bacterium]